MKKILLSLSFITLIGANLLAQVETDSSGLFKSSVDELLKLPVSTKGKGSIASNVIQDENKQPASVTIITKEQLRTSGARTLSEALMMYVPGYFTVEDQDDVIAGFRGLAPDNNSKVMFLINGQNMNTEFFWGPPGALLNSPNMDYIERIEVIRGPGSVTLGQGALLGVINVITADAGNTEGSKAEVGVTAGGNDFYNGTASFRSNNKGLKTFFYGTTYKYRGQELRNEGWAKDKGNEGYLGGKVVDSGLRLKRTNGSMMLGKLEYKGFTLNLMNVQQRQDLYNFYRDRNVQAQNIISANLEYAFKINENIRNKTSISLINDDIGLLSVTGATMGGTAEVRLGVKTIFNIDNLWKNNRLAIGIEGRQFQMGRNNVAGNNFIANKIGTFDAGTANQQLTMVYRQNIDVISIFLEDFYTISPKVDFFAAVRVDKHPYWGTNFVPRIGIFYTPTQALIIRAAYQGGFRGAVGLHYAGGYRRDGMLRADNYSSVGGANIPGSTNIPTIAPERMSSFELAATFKPNKKLNVNLVTYYNQVSNVIDVGVIYQDPTVFTVPNVGTDIAGDWNGYWYFKNTPGTFSQFGAELTVQYVTEKFSTQASYSYAGVTQVSKEQKDIAIAANSMYLAADGEKVAYKAFPQSMFKLNAQYKFTEDFFVSMTSIYYGGWYSPAGAKEKGGILINMALGYNISKNFEFQLTGKNLSNEQNLAPMTSNAGGQAVSPGAPSWERTTYWATGRVKF